MTGVQTCALPIFGVLPKLLETVTASETLPDFTGVQPSMVVLVGVHPVSEAATTTKRAAEPTRVAILRTGNTFQNEISQPLVCRILLGTICHWAAGNPL